MDSGLELIDACKTSFRWLKIPSHTGLCGNEEADQLANEAHLASPLYASFPVQRAAPQPGMAKVRINLGLEIRYFIQRHARCTPGARRANIPPLMQCLQKVILRYHLFSFVFLTKTCFLAPSVTRRWLIRTQMCLNF